MPNTLSTLRAIVASVVLATSVALLPQMLRPVAVPVAFGCGYDLVASRGIFSGGYDMGVVYLWQNQCNRAMHTLVVSDQGTQNLYSAVVVAGVCYNASGQTVPCSARTTGASASARGTALNTAEYRYPTDGMYQGYGCVAGACAATGWVYSAP